MSDKRKTSSARDRARARRKELEAKRQQQRELIEEHQVAYFAACDDIDAVRAKITALEEQLAQLKAREADDTAEARHRAQMEMGALVVEAGQPVEDVAVLLDASENDVRKARTAYRKHHEGGSGSGDAAAREPSKLTPAQTVPEADDTLESEDAQEVA